MPFFSFPYPALLSWYQTHGRHDLPWRQSWHLGVRELGYHVWLSEVLLQQTQVSRAREYYERILVRYPDIADLAEVGYETFFEDWRGAGYYGRARNLLKTAQEVVRSHGGLFPCEYDALRRLPGIGEYTAYAILAFVYDQPVLAIDTNLKKIFARYYYGDRRHPIAPELVAMLREDFRKSRLSGRVMNAAFMDFGSLVSKNSTASVDFGSYPLPWDRYAIENGSNESTTVSRKKIFPRADAQIIVVLHRDHRVYYSASSSQYMPFILPPSEGDTRHIVQDFFKNTYTVEVSVRPVRWHGYIDDVPHLLCHAQIQSGSYPFIEYPPAAKRAWEQTNHITYSS